ncbi:AraC family transcriptional regulator [Nonomuraea lactucae]|uniref:AraC family transcriptional regulator n=1 Tax=Nonomuraea lactucae TaxID=2249762 RepID=UPI000DE21D1D|nr:AraC family transcriptional regulator [Nonomuraea lactucae]
MSTNGVAVQFLRAAIASAETAGIDVRRALRDPSLWPALTRPNASHVSCEQTIKVMRVLWRLTGDELLRLGPRPVPPGTFRMISLGLIHAPDLRTALGRLVEFASITTGYTRSRLVVDGSGCRIEIAAEPAVEVRPLAAEIMLTLVHRFPAWLVAQRIPLSGLELPFPEPHYSAEYAPIFGRTPSFDAPVASISFDARLLAAPVVREERELLHYLRRSPTDLIHQRDYGTTTADRVRNVLERGDMSNWARADDVAARLSISAQHMRRLLRQEGTTFHEIREELLRDIAVASLQRGRESIDEISHRLGFSEPSAFRRAFTRWVGSPPGEYRDRHALTARG